MSRVLQAHGKLYEATAKFQQALYGRLKVLGPEYPGTLAALGNMSCILWAQGKLDEAAETCRTVLDGKLKVLGSDRSTLTP